MYFDNLLESENLSEWKTESLHEFKSPFNSKVFENIYSQGYSVYQNTISYINPDTGTFLCTASNKHGQKFILTVTGMTFVCMHENNLGYFVDALNALYDARMGKINE